MKTAVIVNPAAGGWRSGWRWARRRSLLRDAIGPFDELRTHHPGHGSRLAREALAGGARRLISVGGDGTWHEIVEGYLQAPEAERERAVLGFYPAGSGCDFARHLRYPKREAEVRAMLAAGKVRRLDAVKATVTGEDGRPRTTHWTNMAAFGLGGEVAWLLARTGKPLGGTLSYLLAALGLLLVSRARPYRLRIDGEELEGRFHSVILANTSTTGGGMRIAPQADAEDGRFEIVTFGEMSRWDMLRRLPKLYTGEHIGLPGVGLRQAARLEAATVDEEHRAHLNIDGEACGRLPASFELLRSVLPVISP